MPKKYKVAVVTVLALFVDLLDLTIVNLAIPAIRTEFDASIGLAQLSITVYVVMVAVVMPASGWAADRFGAKRTFLFSFCVFTAGSAFCAAAWNMEALIFARALQGIGGGLLVPVGMASLFRAFTENERATASSIFSAPAAVAPALGPFLGGILIDTVGWRWIFMINVPIGLAALALAALWLDEYRVEDTGPADVKGLILAAVGFVVVTLALSLAPEGPILRLATVAPLLIGLLIIAAFIRVELAIIAPMVDIRLFEERDFALGNVAMFLASFGFGSLLFALPLFLQGPQGIPATQAGTVMAMHAVGIIITTVVGPRLINLFGARAVFGVGLACTGLITFAFALINEGSSLVLIGAVLLFAGGSFGLTVVPLQTIPFRGMNEDRIARGTSILSVVRQLGIASGTAAAAIPLGQGIGTSGFALAFSISGLMTLVAVPAVTLLRRVIKAPQSGKPRRDSRIATSVWINKNRCQCFRRLRVCVCT